MFVAMIDMGFCTQLHKLIKVVVVYMNKNAKESTKDTANGFAKGFGELDIRRWLEQLDIIDLGRESLRNNL